MEAVRPRFGSLRRDRLLGVACGLCLLAAAGASAQTDEGAGAIANEQGRPEEIVVRGRGDSLVGTSDAASQGTIGAEQLRERTLSRPGEVLETVPGVIITQHSGSGKANQFFLRGFNLDHGTDFATSIDSVPVNLPSHGHGQGYSDLNFLIPELIERVDFRKGVYDARDGDFSSAGAADIHYFDALPQGIAKIEGGRFDYYRGVLANSNEIASGNLLYGAELSYDDGPWKNPDRYKKVNGVLRYSGGDDHWGYSITGSAYAGDWNATDQIARRAAHLPGFDRFDSLDPSDGGRSQKYMLYGEWHRADGDSTTRALVYGFYQNLDLFSDFTYFLTSPQGDQIEQVDRRWVGGAKASQTWSGSPLGRESETALGLQLRSDEIHNGLFQTLRRHRVDKLDYAGNTIPANTRRDGIWELSVSPYLDNHFQWTDWMRTVVGGRVDFFHFDVDGNLPGNSGRDNKTLLSPKGSLILGPWAQTELYLSGGLGLHSNDARGVISPVSPADPLVRTRGAEVGVRSTLVPGLQSTVALWWLDVDSELIFAGDAGTTEASRASRRLGIEIANYYSPFSWLTFDADASLSRARFRDSDPAGRYIPGAVDTVAAAGATVHDLGGPFGTIRVRYFGPRPLIEDDSVESSSTVLLSARVGYEFNSTWTIAAEVYNLLDRRDSEIDYFYPSRLAGEPAGPDQGGFDDIQFHPVDPISFRVALSAKF
jgi:outer membrane receptor protein involved in Fe transport